MVAYVLDRIDLSIKEILFFDTYDFSEDIDFTEKSKIIVTHKPNIVNDDYVLCKYESGTFLGICDDIYSASDDISYEITMKQKEAMFDRKIFVGSESLISSTGIEDFIASEIYDNWISTGDDRMDRTYINVYAMTHTPINAKVRTTDGVYNLKTYMGNAKELYGIFYDFEIEDGEMNILIRKKEDSVLPIDVTISDISGYDERYNVNVIAKLLVKTAAADTITPVFLKTDRTLTLDADDPDRADGVIDSLYVNETDTDAVTQAVYDAFKSNSYEHKIEFELSRKSRAYPVESFYVGRNAKIKTKTGIKTSIITKIKYSSDSAFISLVFGKLKVSLIEKLRGGKNG